MSAIANEKHEAFAQGVANGLSPTAAYRAAFPNSVNWRDETVIDRAEALLNLDNVAERIDELQGVAVGAILSRRDRMMLLTHIALNEEQPIKSRLNAIDLLNKMDGEYVKKVEATITQDYADTAADIAAILEEDDD